MSRWPSQDFKTLGSGLALNPLYVEELSNGLAFNSPHVQAQMGPYSNSAPGCKKGACLQKGHKTIVDWMIKDVPCFTFSSGPLMWSSGYSTHKVMGLFGC